MYSIKYLLIWFRGKKTTTTKKKYIQMFWLSKGFSPVPYYVICN